MKSARRYIQMTEKDELIHKSVVSAVNGLREYLQVERKRIPGDILFEADRLECELFSGYDPSFEGDEPLVCTSCIKTGAASHLLNTCRLHEIYPSGLDSM